MPTMSIHCRVVRAIASVAAIMISTGAIATAEPAVSSPAVAAQPAANDYHQCYGSINMAYYNTYNSTFFGPSACHDCIAHGQEGQNAGVWPFFACWITSPNSVDLWVRGGAP